MLQEKNQINLLTRVSKGLLENFAYREISYQDDEVADPGIALIFLGIVLVLVPLFSFNKKSNTQLAHPIRVLLITSGISLLILMVTVALILIAT